MNEELKGYITVPEAARRLGRSTEQVRRYLREGKLPGHRIGGQWFIPQTVLPQAVLRESVAVYVTRREEAEAVDIRGDEAEAVKKSENVRRRRLMERIIRRREAIGRRWEAAGIQVDVMELLRQLREERS